MKDPSTFYEGSMRTDAGTNVEKLVVNPARCRFIGEQDGPSEQQLKAKLLAALARYDTLDFAYLAKIQYSDEPEWSVALCVRCSADSQISAIVSSAADAFHEMFGRDQRLDIIELDHDAWQELRLVCKPFYLRPTDDPTG